MGKILKKIKTKNWALIAMNALAFMMVIQNVNAACVWVDHQPEVPEEAKSFRKF